MDEIFRVKQFVKIVRETGIEWPERFWVEIVSVDYPWYQGRVDNDLLGEEIQLNDIVRFSHRDVVDVHPTVIREV